MSLPCTGDEAVCLAQVEDSDISNTNKGKTNMAKGNIARLIMTDGTAHNCLVDIF